MIFHQPHNSRDSLNYNAYFYSDLIWEPHFHKNPEVVYVLRGEVTCTVRGRQEILRAGEWGMCLSYEIHSYTPGDEALYWVAVFSEDYVRTFAGQMRQKTGVDFRFRCRPAVADYVRVTLMEEKHPDLYPLKSALYALCGEYLASVTPVEKDKNTMKTAAIVDFIEENYTKDIGLRDLARFLGYDYHYVSRYFRTVFSMNFRDFLNQYRLQNALRLLGETGRKVTDIAAECGFQSVRSFNAAFRNSFGMTPTEYRRLAPEELRAVFPSFHPSNT